MPGTVQVRTQLWREDQRKGRCSLEQPFALDININKRQSALDSDKGRKGGPLVSDLLALWAQLKEAAYCHFPHCGVGSSVKGTGPKPFLNYVFFYKWMHLKKCNLAITPMILYPWLLRMGLNLFSWGKAGTGNEIAHRKVLNKWSMVGPWFW